MVSLCRHSGGPGCWPLRHGLPPQRMTPPRPPADTCRTSQGGCGLPGATTEEEPLWFLASSQLSSEGPDPILTILDTPHCAVPTVRVTVLAQRPQPGRCEGGRWPLLGVTREPQRASGQSLCVSGDLHTCAEHLLGTLWGWLLPCNGGTTDPDQAGGRCRDRSTWTHAHCG